jgi:hypothetical protein
VLSNNGLPIANIVSISSILPLRWCDNTNFFRIILPFATRPWNAGPWQLPSTLRRPHDPHPGEPHPMTALATALKDEIRRLARKEIKIQTASPAHLVQ